MTEKNQASVYELAFYFWDKNPKEHITNQRISETLFWLLNAINSGKLEAWYKSQRLNDINGFEANASNTSDVFINFLAFQDFLNKSLDEEFEEKYSDWEDAKKVWTTPMGKDDPKKDLILCLGFIPEKIKQKLIDKYTAHKNEIISEQNKTKVLPCDPGTKWDQIEMALLPDGEKYKVRLYLK
jgi:hypothetical protein